MSTVLAVMTIRALRTRLAFLAASVCLLALGVPTATASHDLDGFLPVGATQAEIKAIETEVLGPEHAAEHAAARQLARRAARGDLPEGNARAALSSEGAAIPAAGPPAEVGEWTEAPFALPTYAINSAVLPTGKVLFWGRPPPPGGGEVRPNVGQASLWNPSLGTGPEAFTDVAPPVIDVDGPGGQEPAAAPIFCSGQSLLPSGEVVVAGGTLAYGETLPDDPYTFWAGLTTIFTFDPWTETWTQQPDLADGRWYPTQTMLPDGRTVIAGGYTQEPTGGVESDSVELFNPPATIGGQGTVEQKPSADRTELGGLDLYPRLFTAGDDLIMTGPRKTMVATLDTADFTWHDQPNLSRNRLAGNAVRRPAGPEGSDTVTTLGGYDRSGLSGPFYPATETSETIDARESDPAWNTASPLNVARANSNTVLLPDGSMVVVGGGSGFMQGDGGGYVVYEDGRARQVEVYDPTTDSWVLGPAQQEDRTYHSTAVLLPDGRIFSAGDDHNPLETGGGASLTDNGEIYSPPYLFEGPRPVIDSAPDAVDWGDAFGIESDSANIERAVLMAPGATTHGVDMNQRHVELEILDQVAGEGVDVVAPPSAAVAPPGHYMLFLLDDAGVPSEAGWVSIDPDAPDQPTLGPPPVPPPGDFNSDGFADRAIGTPLEDVGSASDAGAIGVLYGSGTGLVAAGDQVFVQDDLEGGQISETGDRFGSALATGDFNDDGYADLAAGAPLEDLGTATDAGTVAVLYGSAAGLSAPSSQTWNQDSGGIADAAELNDRLGAALAAADLDGDGDDDLVAGAPSETVGTKAGAGAVSAIYGSAVGLTDAGNQLWHQGSPGIADGTDAEDSFGAALAAADLNGDDRDDLAVGVPAESVGTTSRAGLVNVIYGSAVGLTDAGNQLWHQNSSGISDSIDTGESFGAAIAGGDLNGDAHGDLAVGVPAETVGTTTAGAANVVYGSATGLTSAGNQFWSQNSAEIKDAAEAGDRLGAAVATGDIDADGDDDLILGAPSETVGPTVAGAANVIHGSASGLTSAGNQLWHQNIGGIIETGEAGDSFGAALAAEDLNGDSYGDLAVGVPSESVGGIAGAGALNLLYGSAAGLSSTGNQLWSQESAGILDLAEEDDQFGAVLGVGAQSR